MIEPECFGAALARQIEMPLPAGRQAGIWRLGQAGFAIKLGDTTAFVDVYLSNHCEAVLARPFDHRRLSRAPLDPAEMTMADAVLCSHDHLDHLDVPTLRTVASASPRSVAVVPEFARERMLALDWEPQRVFGTRAGDRIEVGGVEIETFPVAHESWDVDDRLGHPYQGFVLRGNSTTIVHSGDAMADDATAEWIARAGPDLILLPINGRDSRRAMLGFAGNMNAEEAAAFARTTGASAAVPMHYDMFAQNVDDRALERFLQACQRLGQRVIVPPLGGAIFLPLARDQASSESAAASR